MKPAQRYKKILENFPMIMEGIEEVKIPFHVCNCGEVPDGEVMVPMAWVEALVRQREELIGWIEPVIKEKQTMKGKVNGRIALIEHLRRKNLHYKDYSMKLEYVCEDNKEFFDGLFNTMTMLLGVLSLAVVTCKVAGVGNGDKLEKDVREVKKKVSVVYNKVFISIAQYEVWKKTAKEELHND